MHIFILFVDIIAVININKNDNITMELYSQYKIIKWLSISELNPKFTNINIIGTNKINANKININLRQ